MGTQQKTLLTVREQAELLSITWRGLQDFTKRRIVPHVKLGRLVRYNPVEVAKALEKLTVKSI